MRRIEGSLHRTHIHRTSSPNMLEARLDYEYLKSKNNALSKEIAELRKDQTEKQLDIDCLLRQKFNLESKYNHLYNLFSNIEKRSKSTLNHIVECSNELAQIMHITNQVRNLGSRLLDSPAGTSKSKDYSFKQVVTPHAVNGHIIHTPTIRIARYTEPATVTDQRCSLNHEVNQNYGEEDLSSEEEEVENDQDGTSDDPGNRTFESRSTIVSLIHSSLDSLEDDAPRNVNDEDSQMTNEKLSTIQEELEDSSNQQTEMDEDKPVFSGRFQEVKIYLNQLSEKSSRVNNQRGSKNSSADYSEPDEGDSLAVPKASTSYNTTTKFDDSQLSNDDTCHEENFVTHTPKRKSLVERKSIGSPIPPKISRSGHKRRFSGEMSVSSPFNASCSASRTSQAIRQSIISSPAEMDTISDSTLKNRTSQRSMECSVAEANTFGRAITRSIVVPTIDSFIEKNSIHSTPSFESNQTKTSLMNDTITPVISRVNVRKNRIKRSSAVPVVQLTRLELSKEGTEHSICLRSMKLSKSPENSKGSGEKVLSKQQIKREKSDIKRRKLEWKSTTPTSPKKVVISKGKRERSPEVTDAINICQRPKRAAKPSSLKEPNLMNKMRRSR